jgi:hypothetical protein
MVKDKRNAGPWEECNLQIPTYSKATPTFFGREDSMAESFKDSGWRSRGKQTFGITVFSLCSEKTAIGSGSCADGGAEGGGEGLAETLDVGIVLGFDHDAGEGFGAGIT